MTISNKIFYLDSQFTKELPSSDEKIDSIYISGYASVNGPDRAGDVIPSSVWEDGMKNYLKNPIVLAFHDHDDPIGRVVEHKIDDKGLWVKVRVSAAAEVFNLVKDGVITAFSVGFRIHDAEYKPDAELFIIKKLELMEISVVSVPCNQDTLFSLSKSFDNDEEYIKFKSLFNPSKDNSAKGLEDPKTSNSKKVKEVVMTTENLDIEKMVAAAAEKAARSATEALLAKQKADAEAAERAAAAEAELQSRINKAIAAVTPSTTGADKLLEDLTKRLDESEKTNKAALEGLEAALKEKAEELAAMTKSKMAFGDKNTKSDISYTDKETAFLLSKISGKSIDATKFGKALVEKALGAGAATSPHNASQTWEHEVSMNMEDEIRRRLVIAPLMRNISMQTNVMSLPINPEAGYGTWVTNAQFGTTDSPGAAQTHTLKELTINAYKLATREYLNYEEEEDSLIVLLPIIRDAMVRRVAKSVEKALAVGAGVGADPVKGLGLYDATSAVTVTNTGTVSIANFRALRKDLGVWGLETDNVVFLVSTDTYYDLLEATEFMTMDKVGAAATLLTGQVGAIGNIPVIVCPELHAKTTGTSSSTTNIGAIAVARGNFLVGNQRGVRFDTQDLVETQRRVLVASLRMGMTQLSTVNGQAVSALRWT